MWFFIFSFLKNAKRKNLERQRLQKPVPAARSTPPKTGCETVWLVPSVWSMVQHTGQTDQIGSHVSILGLNPQRTACSGAARRSSGTPARSYSVHIRAHLSPNLRISPNPIISYPYLVRITHRIASFVSCLYRRFSRFERQFLHVPSRVPDSARHYQSHESHEHPWGPSWSLDQPGSSDTKKRPRHPEFQDSRRIFSDERCRLSPSHWRNRQLRSPPLPQRSQHITTAMLNLLPQSSVFRFNSDGYARQMVSTCFHQNTFTGFILVKAIQQSTSARLDSSDSSVMLGLHVWLRYPLFVANETTSSFPFHWAVF